MAHDPPELLAIGDSLTAGYGLAPAQSFAALLQAQLRERWAGAVVRNAGVSGDTTQDGLRRLPALLSALGRRPDLAIVELGVNDLFRGVPPERTRANLDAILRELGRCGIPVLVASFQPPPMMGAYGAGYGGIHAAVAARHGAAVAPFFPPGVLGRPDLVLADGIHPNARAIEMVVAAFLPAVTAMLGPQRAASEQEPASPR